MILKKEEPESLSRLKFTMANPGTAWALVM
jgi:hypothetical protein